MSNSKGYSKQQPFTIYLLGGLVAGIVGALVCNIYYGLFESIAEETFEELNLVSITLTTVGASLVGSLVYFWMHRKITGANTLFAVAGLLFGLLSLVPPTMSPPNPSENFMAAAAPMHVLAAISCVIIVPLFVERFKDF